MKIVAAVTLALVGASSVEACPVFRYRWAGNSNKALCLTTTSQGLATTPCDDSNHSQMMVLESTNVPGAFYTGSHTSEEFLVEMKRTYANTFTISTQGRCVGANGALGACPEDTKPKGKGKAYKRAAAPMMKGSWYVEPLLSVPFDAPKASGHDGHDHGEPAMTMTDSHDGHDHANGSHEPAPTFSSWTAGLGSSSTGLRVGAATMVSPQAMDSHAGHDHANGSHEPAPAFSSWSSSTWGTANTMQAMDSHDGHDHANGSHEPAPSAFSSRWGTTTTMPAMDSHDGHDHANGSHEPAKPRCRFTNGAFICN